MLSCLLSYSLNSLKGVISGIRRGTARGVIKGDARSLGPKPETLNAKP